MKRIMCILFLMSFVYLLKADEDAIPDEIKMTFEDYPSIELAVTSMDYASNKEQKPDREYAYLKDPSSEEGYKVAKVSIQYKDSTNELKTEKESEKSVENLKNTDTAVTSHSLNNESIFESPNNTDSNKQNQTLIDKIHDKKILNENETISDRQEDRKVDAKLVEKSFKSDSESTTTPNAKTTIDDIMDDLIINKNMKKYDDDEYDKSLFPETLSKSDESDSELDGLDHDFRPKRRMFDFVPEINYKGKSESHELLEPSILINTHQPPYGDRPNPSYTFSPILLSNKPIPDPYRLKNLWLPHNYNEGPNPSGDGGDSRDMLNPNPREILFGPNDEEVNKLNIQNGFGILQEMINNPNRMAEEPEISGPNKWDQAPTSYNEPNLWMQHVMTVPTKWKLAPGYQNIPNYWLHPSTLNIPNNFNPTRTKPSQEIYDPSYFGTNAILPFEYTTLDSNAYPYVTAKKDKIAEMNINPIYRNLALPSILPNPQLPYIRYGIIRHPGAYARSDPILMARRNLALVPRSRPFLIDNSFLFNRMCCY
uniref:Uncharacterized protein n=1 Tax=Pieris rapae TaxID=64459 RepID=A0A220K8P3_PIERA|nr:hypothetical protein [Pieris rapae]